LTSAEVVLIVPDEHMLRIYSKKAKESETPAVSVVKSLVKIEIPSSETQKLYIQIPMLRGRLFFFDEANVSWCPQTGRVYRIIGEEYPVNTPGKNQTKYILGSLEYPSCSGLYEIYPRKRHQEFQAHLEHLLNEYPDDFLFVIRDSASQHVTEDLDDFLLSKSDRLCLVPLPTYSPHLNLIERLWHYMRDNITRSYFYRTFVELCETLIAWLLELPDERFLSLIGLSP